MLLNLLIITIFIMYKDFELMSTYYYIKGSTLYKHTDPTPKGNTSVCVAGSNTIATIRAKAATIAKADTINVSNLSNDEVKRLYRQAVRKVNPKGIEYSQRKADIVAEFRKLIDERINK